MKTVTTVLRWRQLSNSGSNQGEWAIDHIQIVGTTAVPTVYLFSEDFYPSPTLE